jgi:DNA-binding NtrC family response regulator
MGRKILILDDEQEFMVTLRDFLKELGHTVEATMFPKHALDIISSYKPELVLFDYKLPDMDGDTFLKKAKEYSGKSKYILMTAYRDDAIVEKFKKMGVASVILKPVDLKDLLSKIENTLNHSK